MNAPTRYERIDLGDPTEVALWTDALGITAAELAHAVAAVGNLAAPVVSHLLDAGLIRSATLAAALRSAQHEDTRLALPA